METQTVQITELKRESNIPIYQTNVNPITYATKSPAITRETVKGVEGAYLLHNVLTPEECQQYIKLTETMGIFICNAPQNANNLFLIFIYSQDMAVRLSQHLVVWL